MEQKVKAILIIEIAGRPADYVKETLKAHIEQMRTIKNIKLIDYTLSDPKKLEAEQEMYTCFAEVEVETPNLSRMIDLVFDFLPSSIEILEPTNLNLNLNETTSFLSDLAGRLHKYDEVAKVAQFQNQHLIAQIRALQQKLKELSPTEEKKEAIQEKPKKSKKK